MILDIGIDIDIDIDRYKKTHTPPCPKIVILEAGLVMFTHSEPGYGSAFSPPPAPARDDHSSYHRI